MKRMRNTNTARLKRQEPRLWLRAAWSSAAVLSIFSITGCNEPPKDISKNFAQTDATRLQIERGRKLFELSWTHALGAGHRNSRGIVDLDKAERMGSLGLEFEVFATPAVTSCLACHNVPNGLTGGAGQLVTNVIVVRKSDQHQRGGKPNTLDEVIVNASLPPTVFGAGFVEMIARQMSAELAEQRDRLEPGESTRLSASNISFGTLSRTTEGRWNTSGVSGLSQTSLNSRSPDHPPSLQIKPFHQTGSIASIREFTINAFDFHLGIQATERYGQDSDPDRDGVINELTTQQLNDIVLFQAALSPPEPAGAAQTSSAAIDRGARSFTQFGCADCHQPTIALNDQNWVFTDYDNNGAITAQIDLTDSSLQGPRPSVHDDKVEIRVYSDFKLHDLSDESDSRSRDALHMHTLIGSEEFFGGTSRFLTARLWGVSQRPPYFNHGHYTSLREAIEGHGNEGAASRQAFRDASGTQQQDLLHFLESL